jgi:hypothetical protein
MLVVTGDDGLFTVRPDGTGITRLTHVIPRWQNPVWQPVSPSAAAAEVANTIATETMPPPITTEVIPPK